MYFSPLEQYEIISILSLTVGWIDISLTNSSLMMIITVFIAYHLNLFALKTSKLIPTRWQSVSELMYEFIHNIIQEQVGNKGQEHFPFLKTLFVFILTVNLIGMIPYNFTSTSHIVVTFSLSLAVFIGVTYIGFKKHKWHFFTLLAPSGVPLALSPLIIIIEFISYLARAVSLGVRLMANMFAGHTLLKIMSTFAWQMIIAGGIITVLGLAPLMTLFALTGLEMVIAFLQAYVFTVLACSYLNDSINLH
jgi:ATP synthase subunit 6